MASPLLRQFTAETSNDYVTPSPMVFMFMVDAGVREHTPYLETFTAETSNAYPTGSPELLMFSVDAGVREHTPYIQGFTAETSNAYPTGSPEVLHFSLDAQNVPVEQSRVDGKQLMNASLPETRLTEGTSYTKADGTRAATGPWTLNSQKLTSVGTPTAATDILNKSHLDAFVLGVSDFKPSVRVATAVALPANTRTSNTLTASANGSINSTGIDGITSLALNNRVLVKNEALGENNGIYRISDLGSVSTPWVFVRVVDMDTDAETTGGASTTVLEGSQNNGTRWVLTTNDPITLNTTSLTFSQVTGLSYATAGAGLTKTGDTLDVGAGDGISVTGNNLQVIASAIVGTGLEVDVLNNIRLATPGDGLTGGSGSPLAVQTSAIAGAGLEDDLANNLRLDTPGNGLTGGGGSPLAVRENGLSVSALSGGLKAAVPARVNKSQNPIATSGNEQSTGITITSSPSGGYIRVRVNGFAQELGDGVKTKDCYFSSDGGTTAKSISSVAIGDTLIWNGTIAGFNLGVTDEVDLDYCTVI